jgi:dTDP-glucose 4,6-dehydratase
VSKNILITGGAGFIGHQAIRNLLVNTDWNLFFLDRLSYAANLERIDYIVGDVGGDSKSRINFIYHDLKAAFNENLLKKIANINIIVHIGASSHVTKSVENPEIFIQDNIVGTFNLLEAARKISDLELFYYFSTDEVFGPSDEDVKFKEWDRYNSKNPYSATKAAGEELTIAYSNTYSIPSVISHCSNVYGERQHLEKFIPNTIRKILNGEKILVHTDSNGVPGSRYYIHNEDVASSITFILNNFKIIKEESFKKYKKEPAKINISGESLISNLEVVEKIGEIIDEKYEYELISNDPDRPGHDIKYGLDNTLLKSVDGFYDRKFDQGIFQTVNWYLSNKNWLS